MIRNCQWHKKMRKELKSPWIGIVCLEMMNPIGLHISMWKNSSLNHGSCKDCYFLKRCSWINYHSFTGFDQSLPRFLIIIHRSNRSSLFKKFNSCWNAGGTITVICIIWPCTDDSSLHQYIHIEKQGPLYTKADVPNSPTDINQIPMFGYYVVWLQEQIPKKRHVFKRDWIACSKYINKSRLISQHNWGGPIWPFCELQKNEESDSGLHLNLLTILYKSLGSHPRISG